MPKPMSKLPKLRRQAAPGAHTTAIALALAATLLGGCGSAPKPAPAPAPAPTPAPYDAAAPATAPVAPAPELPRVPTPEEATSAQKLALGAVEMLEAGDEERALAELQQAQRLDPGNKLAQSLLRQIRDDPVALLGAESFNYRVPPGESLSRIAQRFLGDKFEFYALARYNDIKVPRQLAGGQVIKVPGKAPAPTTPAPRATPRPGTAAPAAAAPSPSPVPATSVPPPAPPPAAAAEPAGPTDAQRAEQAERERRQSVQRLTAEARRSFARQDLDGAIRQWDQVLALDADNATARLERQRAVELRDKLRKLPKSGG
jgi:tetratricopeptide (TPR) repeat protein